MPIKPIQRREEHTIKMTDPFVADLVKNQPIIPRTENKMRPTVLARINGYKIFTLMHVAAWLSAAFVSTEQCFQFFWGYLLSQPFCPIPAPNPEPW